MPLESSLLLQGLSRQGLKIFWSWQRIQNIQAIIKIGIFECSTWWEISWFILTLYTIRIEKCRVVRSSESCSMLNGQGICSRIEWANTFWVNSKLTLYESKTVRRWTDSLRTSSLTRLWLLGKLEILRGRTEPTSERCTLSHSQNRPHRRHWAEYHWRPRLILWNGHGRALENDWAWEQGRWRVTKSLCVLRDPWYVFSWLYVSRPYSLMACTKKALWDSSRATTWSSSPNGVLLHSLVGGTSITLTRRKWLRFLALEQKWTGRQTRRGIASFFLALHFDTFTHSHSLTHSGTFKSSIKWIWAKTFTSATHMMSLKRFRATWRVSLGSRRCSCRGFCFWSSSIARDKKTNWHWI